MTRTTQRSTGILGITVLLMIAGCTPSIVSDRYKKFEHTGEPLWIVPFRIERVDWNRPFLPQTLRDTLGTLGDPISLPSRFVAEFLIEAMVEGSAFEDVALLAGVDSSSWKVRTLYPRARLPHDAFDAKLPRDGGSIGDATSGFGLLLLDVVLDERRRSGPDGFRSPRTATFNFVLWHAVDGEVYSWGAAGVDLDARLDTEQDWRDLAAQFAWRITRNTAFETEKPTEPLYWMQ